MRAWIAGAVGLLALLPATALAQEDLRRLRFLQGGDERSELVVLWTGELKLLALDAAQVRGHLTRGEQLQLREATSGARLHAMPRLPERAAARFRLTFDLWTPDRGVVSRGFSGSIEDLGPYEGRLRPLLSLLQRVAARLRRQLADPWLTYSRVESWPLPQVDSVRLDARGLYRVTSTRPGRQPPREGRLSRAQLEWVRRLTTKAQAQSPDPVAPSYPWEARRTFSLRAPQAPGAEGPTRVGDPQQVGASAPDLAALVGFLEALLQGTPRQVPAEAEPLRSPSLARPSFSAPGLARRLSDLGS